MNHTLSAAERQIADMEKRIAQQSALSAELARAGRDTTQAQRVLRMLQRALELTRKHTEIFVDASEGPRAVSHVSRRGRWLMLACGAEPDRGVAVHHAPHLALRSHQNRR